MSYLQTNNTIIKNKAGLLNLAQELGNISKACKVMGFLVILFIATKMPLRTEALKP